MRKLFVVPFIVAASLMSPELSAAEPEASSVEFFEKKIRPVLVKHCYECHSSKAAAVNKLKGGLRVDSREALRIGGDSGPGVMPGKPDESSLIAALKYESVEMPPKGKLPDEVIADFVKWIEQGAVDPRVDPAEATTKKSIDIEAGRKFWAYQPPQQPTIPTVKNAAWPSRDVDRFILAKLEAQGLQPVSDADAVTLIRRLYYDLVGLPPTPDEIDAFLKDCGATDLKPQISNPQFAAAYERLVDRLLASKHFGERWGRHWLDVARYAESLTLRGFVLKDAWRYRDYVIESFNDDLPFDQFVREQIAGDLLTSESEPLDVRRRKLVATSFLAIGNNNLEEQDKKQLAMDVVDEQLETLSKAFLGQTIGCARCHDHKFDPIPTKDYYALAGILKNSKTLEHSNVSKWMEVPLPMAADDEAAVRKHNEQVAELKRRIDATKALAKADSKPESPDDKPAKKPIAIASLVGVVVDDAQVKKVGDWTHSQHSKFFVGDGYLHDGSKGKGEKTLSFDPDLPTTGKYEVRLAYSPGAGRSTEVPVTIFSADGEKTVLVNESETPPIDGLFVSLGQYRFEVGGQSFVLVSNEGTKGHVTADAVVFIPIEKLATVAATSDAAKPVVASAAKEPQPAAESLKQLEEDMKKLQASGPKRDTTISVVEEKQIADVRIHIRGSVQTQGEHVPRGFLQVATRGSGAPLPVNQSGRRELAEWLVEESNPLTARVMTNRVWHWLFGAGLVRTTDNFGTTGELPSHPELLDHLTVQFVRESWSVKRLVREIVLSRTYRLSSAAAHRQISELKSQTPDPENRLLSHMNRRRLEAECIRDTILQVSGRLQLEAGGPSFDTALNSDFGFQHKDSRRSVYAPLFRNSPPELFEVFDSADPSTVTGRRNSSTVAPQALFLMNHPFVLDESKHAAKRLLGELELTEDARIVLAYRWTLGRHPTAAEHDIARRFVAGKDSSTAEAAWTSLFQTLFASIDFRYVN